MKKILLIGLMGFFFSNLVNAKNKNFEGYYITQNNDSVKVTFPFYGSGEPSYHRMQKKIRCFDSAHKNKVLKPDQVKEVGFVFNGEQIKFISMHNNTLNYFSEVKHNNIFLKLEVEVKGKHKLFLHYETVTDTRYNGYLTPREISHIELNYYLQQGEGKLVAATQRDIEAYVRDCPMLKEKFNEQELSKKDYKTIDPYKKKDYKQKDYKEILKLYNESCNKEAH